MLLDSSYYRTRASCLWMSQLELHPESGYGFERCHGYTEIYLGSRSAYQATIVQLLLCHAERPVQEISHQYEVLDRSDLSAHQYEILDRSDLERSYWESSGDAYYLMMMATPSNPAYGDCTVGAETLRLSWGSALHF